jgi:branched-chain amino acid transport system ATP-binding protein
LQGQPFRCPLPTYPNRPVMVNEVFKIIHQLHTQDQIPILLVEQNLKHALSLSDYAYVMENGRIVLEGTSDEVMKNEHTRKAYLGI